MAVGIAQCAPDGVSVICVCPGPTPQDQLAWVRAAIVGSWIGTAHTPWTEDYGVGFRFYADGRYETTSEDPQNPALYYGSVIPEPGMVVFLDDVNAGGTASGTIVIAFQGGGFTNLIEDEIEHVTLSAKADALSFDVVHLGQYGPMHYELKRAPNP